VWYEAQYNLRGSSWTTQKRGSGEGSPPVGSRGKAPVGGLGMNFPEADDIFLKGKVSTKKCINNSVFNCKTVSMPKV